MNYRLLLNWPNIAVKMLRRTQLICTISKSRYYKERQVDRKKRKAIRL